MNYKYDVVLSFADEDKNLANSLMDELSKRGINCFFYLRNEDPRSGKNLHIDLGRLYRHEARFAIVFLSEPYFQKKWTQVELEYILQRSQLYEDYMLLVKTDNVVIPKMSNLSEEYIYYQWNTHSFKLISDLSNRMEQYRQDEKKVIESSHQKSPEHISDTAFYGDGSMGIVQGNVVQHINKK